MIENDQKWGWFFLGHGGPFFLGHCIIYYTHITYALQSVIMYVFTVYCYTIICTLISVINKLTFTFVPTCELLHELFGAQVHIPRYIYIYKFPQRNSEEHFNFAYHPLIFCFCGQNLALTINFPSK